MFGLLPDPHVHDETCQYVVICQTGSCADAIAHAGNGNALDGTPFGGLGERLTDGERFAFVLWGIGAPARVRIWAQLDDVHADAQLFCVRDTPDWAQLSGWEGDDLTPWALPG